MIPRRSKLIFGVLLLLPQPHSLLAASQRGDYPPALDKEIHRAAEQALDGIGRPATAGGRLQLAAALGTDIPLSLEEDLQTNPQNLQLKLALLHHYLKQQDNTRALALAKQLYTAYPGNTEVLKALVTALLANGDTDAALEQADKLTQSQPNSPDAWYLLGLANIRKLDNAAAH